MKTSAWDRGLIFLFALVLWSGFSPVQTLAASSAADFYKGKILTWVCQGSPGGGYDIWVRLLAPAMQKITGATVVIKNITGASGLVASNYVYTQAKPDGLTIAITQSFTTVIDYLFDNPGVKYDFKKFTWLGRLSTDDYVFSVGKDSRYKTLREIKVAPTFKMGLNSRTAVNGAGVTAFALAAGLGNVRLVVGYEGSSEIRLAVIRGEVDGTSTSIGTQWEDLKAGLFIPVAVVGRERAKSLPDVPTIYEANSNMPVEIKKWVDRLVLLQDMGRGVYAPPGVPKDKADFLRDAIRKALQDPIAVNRLKKLAFDVVYLPAAEYQKQLESLEMSPQDRSELKNLMLKKY